jgi:hypothetical protein
VPPDDDGDESPATLTPADQTLLTGVPDIAVASGAKHGVGRYVVNVNGGSWVTIRNYAGSYVLGDAHDGWTFDADGHAYKNGLYFVGRVHGHYGGCGWIIAKQLDPTSHVATACNGYIAKPTSFGRAFNCKKCGRGTPVGMVTSADECANVLPVHGGTLTCQDYVRRGVGPYLVDWRYVTVDGRWVMVKDPNFQDATGSWVFIPRSALPATLPVSTP